LIAFAYIYLLLITYELLLIY